jgi:hypothetical protein
MKVAVAVVACLVACEGKQPTSSTGSGSAVATAPADAATPTCDLAGPYRVRFASNGAEGWWLRFKVDKDKLVLAEDQEMLGLVAGPQTATLDVKTCALTLIAKTKQAGDLKIAMQLDAKNIVIGTLTRTDEYGAKDGPTKVHGVRDAPPKPVPACLHPGVYELGTTDKAKWKLSEGHPRFGMKCQDMAEPITRRTVRIEQLGDDITVDEVSGEKHEQSFGRGVVKRTGECTITLAMEVQDFKYQDAALTFAGDTITGTAPTATYQFMEDGEAGENLWGCTAKQPAMAGKRIAD